MHTVTTTLSLHGQTTVFTKQFLQLQIAQEIFSGSLRPSSQHHPNIKMFLRAAVL